MDLQKVAEKLTILSRFLGRRDVQSLTCAELEKNYAISRADLLILFGGSIAEGCNIAGNAMKNNVAERLMIVGGEGHTTRYLRDSIHSLYPQIPTSGRMEADIMSDFIRMKYGINDILIEDKSTNCGNNVTFALEKLEEKGIYPKSIILVQDAAMQCRMDAGFRKYLPNRIIINYAAYAADFILGQGELAITSADLWGMWNTDQYITLLMGEIPRLSDDQNGYGPNGKDFIAHVDIPKNIRNAFECLKTDFGTKIRIANPEYAT